jgi:5-methylcytosine-specific restriction enzyme subunit McrC
VTGRQEVLQEYESRQLELTPDLVRHVLAAAPALQLSPTTTAGRYVVTASDLVGTIALPGLDILIRPKVGIENLFVLLDSGLPAEALSVEDARLEANADFLAVFADFFARSVHLATGRGLLRTYRQHEEVLVAPRGRIDFAAQVRRAMLPSPLECRFDEFTADVTENQLLLGTIERLLRLTELAPSVRSTLRSLRTRFEDVTPRRPEVADFDRIVHTRLSEHYRAPLGLARLIAQNLSLADQHGSTIVSSFLLDMPIVYEQFVTNRLQRHLRGRLTVEAQAEMWLAEHNRVRVRPDLVFRKGAQPVFVGDVKYKLSSGGLARSSDYYQLLAYCETLDLHQGVLVYAQTDGAPPVKDAVVRHSGRHLHTYRLDVGGDPAAIDRAVRELAGWVAARCG